MKKSFIPITLIIFGMFAIACNGGNTRQSSGTAAPSAPDSMPLQQPGRTNSSGAIKTPPIGDSNVVKPNSSSTPL